MKSTNANAFRIAVMTALAGLVLALMGSAPAAAALPQGREATPAVVNPALPSELRQTISLDGEWQFATDPKQQGDKEQWYPPPEQPNLYRADIVLKRDGKVIDGWAARFGVRKWEVRGGDFYLNNSRHLVRAYGPCRVSALAGDGVPVEIDRRTEYPFGDIIEMTMKAARPVAFPLSLRIPGWCKTATIAVNGSAVSASPDGKGFVRVERTWKASDVVRLQFPMAIQVNTGLDKNLMPPAPYATVSYGPLLMALPIADRGPNMPDPAAKWNYAMETEAEKLGADMTMEQREGNEQ